MDDELTALQHQAIEMLISGQKLHNIADAVGVSLQTLWRWRQLPEFQQAYQERQQIRREEMREQMVQIAAQALAVVERELTRDYHAIYRESQLKAALRVLRMLRPAQCFEQNPALLTRATPMDEG